MKKGKNKYFKIIIKPKDIQISFRSTQLEWRIKKFSQTSTTFYTISAPYKIWALQDCTSNSKKLKNNKNG